ncbi:MAG: hypothetical protein LBJ77_03385 [Holosporales bacterium]|jgi:hypothetical protein|nr:hypothetical protein [Holosporales bacterium]
MKILKKILLTRTLGGISFCLLFGSHVILSADIHVLPGSVVTFGRGPYDIQTDYPLFSEAGWSYGRDLARAGNVPPLPCNLGDGSSDGWFPTDPEYLNGSFNRFTGYPGISGVEGTLGYGVFFLQSKSVREVEFCFFRDAAFSGYWTELLFGDRSEWPDKPDGLSELITAWKENVESYSGGLPSDLANGNLTPVSVASLWKLLSSREKQLHSIRTILWTAFIGAGIWAGYSMFSRFVQKPPLGSNHRLSVYSLWFPQHR